MLSRVVRDRVRVRVNPGLTSIIRSLSGTLVCYTGIVPGGTGFNNVNIPGSVVIYVRSLLVRDPVYSIWAAGSKVGRALLHFFNYEVQPGEAEFCRLLRDPGLVYKQ